MELAIKMLERQIPCGRNLFATSTLYSDIHTGDQAKGNTRQHARCLLAMLVSKFLILRFQ